MKNVTTFVFVAIIVLVAAGCRTQLLSLPDGSQDSSCVLAPVRIDSFGIEDLNACPADLLRVDFQVTLPPCAPLPKPLLTFDSSANAYTVTARACSPGCTLPQSPMTYTVFLSETARPSAGTATVRDGAPGGTASLQLEIQPSVGGVCGDPLEGGCMSDAECIASDPTTRCWQDNGQECIRICWDDTDCSSAAPHCTGGFCSTTL